MATTYEDIRDDFMSSIVDYDFLKLTDGELQEVITQNMQTALRLCEFEDITYDDMMEVFNRDLNNLERIALTNYMIYNWIVPKVNNITAFQYRLSSNDYKRYSESKMLSELIKAKNDAYKTASYYVNKCANKKLTKNLGKLIK